MRPISPTARLAVVTLLTLAPLVLAQERERPGRGRGRDSGDFTRRAPLMLALDADQDGALSAAEIAGAATALASLDKDADGNLTSDELAPGPGGDGGGRRRGGFGGFGGRGRTPPVMAALDLDRDGELFEDEVTDAATLLLTLDTDGDGALGADEIAPSFGRGGRGGRGGGAFGGGFRGGGGRETPLEPSELEFNDGTASIPDHATYRKLSYKGAEVMVDTHLAGLEFVKFTLIDADTERPRIYFINTETHRGHPMFGRVVGLPFDPRGGSGQMLGVLVYRPLLASPSGTPGYYTFEFEPNNSFPFERVKIAFDMLRTHAPLLEGKLGYHPLPAALERYEDEKQKYADAGLPVFLPDDVYGEIGFLPLNHAESYGRLRLMQPGERPGPRDIVLYTTLPNEMPRVAGVITAARQTPLSHVNLRAIQDRVPNAFVTRANELESITSLVGKYIHYKVDADGYELREATAEEVESHFAALRPAEPQTPRRDLSVTEIRPLERIGFGDAAIFGVKSANLATLRTLGLPEDVVPNGYAVPFAFYDAFMKHNGLYEVARSMLVEPSFQSDADARVAALEEFRATIVAGDMPDALFDALGAVQASFPPGTSIRCRSSTNNEDLPGFSGAGLYDSSTHDAREGNLAATVKRVYASLWNFRAFEEREFYRIDHMATAMGVLLHPNYSGERSNGVAVSKDIVYQTADQGSLLYYVNVQVGEDLVTNPEEQSVPEELLLAPRNPRSDRLVRRSNRVADDTRLLDASHLKELRRCLRTIHKEFARLYDADDDEGFAMEIEFKVTAEGRLAVKQARPWVQ